MNKTTDLKQKIRELIKLNFDTYHYFFAKADERWLDWLWSNGLLSKIKLSTKLVPYSYQMPELNYLVRMATIVPSKVADIISAVPNKLGACNPEVIDRFLFIISQLPVDQIKRLAPKIKNEEWVRIMARFDHWGYEYEKILEKLKQAGDYESMLVLAEDILSIVKKDKPSEKGGISSRDPFCFKGLSHSSVFEHLADIKGQFVEGALSLVAKVMSEMVNLGGISDDKDDIFQIKEDFRLYRVDFFTIEPGETRRISDRDDVEELVALVKALARKLMAQNEQETRIREIYTEYFLSLPNSVSMYRLRLFIISLYPVFFREEIKSQIFGIFEHKTPWDLICPEYEHLIQKCFSVLTEEEKRDYVSKAIELFSNEGSKSTGRRIFSCIYNVLKPEEIESIEKNIGSLDQEYKPRALIETGRGGTVVAQAPGTDNDWNVPISEIVERLKKEWSPAELKQTYHNKEDYDFLRPTNAEGVGERLKKDIESRLSEYLDEAGLFFNRGTLHPHYTHSYLRALSELVRGDKLPPDLNLSGVFKLMETIRISGEAREFEEPASKRDESGWLGSWNAVHDSMVELLKEILEGESGKLLVNFTDYRVSFFALVKYLLGHKDPELKDEQIETAKSRTTSGTDEGYVVTDPYSNAINSVRGKAFQALVAFIFHDGKRLESVADPKKIDEDVKELYRNTLRKEGTRALMFMFGHYVSTIYYRDTGFLYEMLPFIFPSDPTKEYLYVAALEGYLANSLYKEIFLDAHFQDLYRRAIEQPLLKDNRKYFRDPDQGLATHFALAFIYLFKDFDINHPNFKLFWEKSDNEAKEQFIGFFGRSFVSGRNQDADSFLKENPEVLEKMKSFWDWSLENCSDPEPLSSFDYWMNPEKNLFDLKWLTQQVRRTIEKTKGGIDWDYGLSRHIVEMARVAPKDALEILRIHILEGGVRNRGQRTMYLHDEWTQALGVLYDIPDTKAGTVKLIDDLVREGGSMFWKHKELLKEK